MKDFLRGIAAEAVPTFQSANETPSYATATKPRSETWFSSVSEKLKQTIAMKKAGRLEKEKVKNLEGKKS